MSIVYPQQYANKYLNSFDRTKLAKYGGAFSQGQHVVLGARLRVVDKKLEAQKEDTDKALDEILNTTGTGVNVFDNFVIPAAKVAKKYRLDKHFGEYPKQMTPEEMLKMFHQVKGDGFVEDAARSATHAIVDTIPIVGQLIPNDWIDKACDWIGDNIWDPIKKFFTGQGLSEDNIVKEREKFLIENEKKISKIAKELLEADVKTGTGVIPSYIKKLRDGDNEEKQLADRLAKTITKPRFNKYVNSIPLTTNIVDAVKSYKGRKNKKQVFKARTKEDIIGSGFKYIQ